MARPRYTESFKERAVELAVEHGPAEASRMVGVKAGTVRAWCSRAGVVTVATERTAAATTRAHQRWEERRAVLTHRIGEVAELALDVTERALQKGETRKASDASATVARLVDKAQLLSGGNTSRIGTDTERDAVLEDAREKALHLVA